MINKIRNDLDLNLIRFIIFKLNALKVELKFTRVLPSQVNYTFKYLV